MKKHLQGQRNGCPDQTDSAQHDAATPSLGVRSDRIPVGLGLEIPSALRDSDPLEDGRPVRAQVRAAVELGQDQVQRLQDVLERHFGGPVQLDVVVDAAILGGVWVRVGDTVIDGSLRGRLEMLRHDLRGQCRILIQGSGEPAEQGSGAP